MRLKNSSWEVCREANGGGCERETRNMRKGREKRVVRALHRAILAGVADTLLRERCLDAVERIAVEVGAVKRSESGWMSGPEVRALFGISKMGLHRWVSRGLLCARGVPGMRPRFRRFEVLQLLERRHAAAVEREARKEAAEEAGGVEK